MSRIKAIIFDLDGTLINSARDLAASVNYTLGKLGLAARPLDEIRSFVGDGVQTLIVRAVGDQHRKMQGQALDIFKRHYGGHLLDQTMLYPGVAETMAELHGKYKMAVLTNKSHDFSEKILQGLGIFDYFDAVIGGDTLPVRKPDPGTILHLAEMWGITPEQIVMVGDHVTDIKTGLNSGARTVFFTNGMGITNGLTPDVTIDSMAELPTVISQHFLQ